MQVHRQDAVGAGGGYQVGHQLGGDGGAPLILAVLARVSEVGDYRGDPLSRGTPGAIDENQQFHHASVDRAAGRLDDEDVFSANVLFELDH